MQIIKTINQVLAFLLELGMFFGVSYWGFLQGKNTFTKWTFAIICFGVAVILWGIFASPNSQTRLSFPIRLVFELAMFLLASFLIYKLNYPLLSFCFAILSILSVGIAYLYRQ